MNPEEYIDNITKVHDIGEEEDIYSDNKQQKAQKLLDGFVEKAKSKISQQKVGNYKYKSMNELANMNLDQLNKELLLARDYNKKLERVISAKKLYQNKQEDTQPINQIKRRQTHAR